RFSLQAALAWRDSRQRDRRVAIRAWEGDSHWGWVPCVRAREWIRVAVGETPPLPPRIEKRTTRAVLGMLDGNGRDWDEDMVALSRTFSGAGPFWPETHFELMLLRTWPSRRAQVANTLQLFASMGGDKEMTAQLLKASLVSGGEAMAAVFGHEVEN